MSKPVWYACYGSNLSVARFRIYLEGGTRAAGSKVDPPCPAGAAIADSRPFMINRRLYFARSSPNWDDGGAVAFVEVPPTEPAPTYGRLYLLSFEQLQHVVARENSTVVERINLGYDDLSRAATVSTGWYDHLLPLGTINGIPVVTLTAGSRPKDDAPLKRSNIYIATMCAGLAETYPWPLLSLDLAKAYLDEALIASGL